MTTINLYQNQQETEKKRPSLALNSGFVFSLGILLVTILTLVGIKVASSVLSGNNASLQEKIKKANGSLAGFGSIEKIYDLQTRIDQIKNNLQIKNNEVSRLAMTQILDHLQEDLSSGAVLSSYKYENGKVAVSFNANNFNDASRQILNFKKSNFFTDANLTSIKRGEKNIICDVEMNIKNQN